MFDELRGPKGFESLYQGKSCSIPIVLSIRESGLDKQAEVQYERLRNAFLANGSSFPVAADGNGISPFLIAGLRVPQNSSVLILIPGINLPGDNRYKYVLAWRIRSFASSEENAPFHGRLSTLGPTDDGSLRFFPPVGGPAWTGKAQDRLPLPGGGDSLVYAQTEPTAPDTLAQQVCFQVISQVKYPFVASPIFPGFTPSQFAYGELSQGLVKDPSPTDSLVSHVPIVTRAMGDELCVLVFRDAIGPSVNWDFLAGGTDELIGAFYGRGSARTGAKNIGVMVATGVQP